MSAQCDPISPNYLFFFDQNGYIGETNDGPIRHHRQGKAEMSSISDLKARFRTALAVVSEAAANDLSHEVDTLNEHVANLKTQLDAESADNHILREAQEAVAEKQEQFETNKASLMRADENNARLQSEIDTLKTKRENDLREVNSLVDQLEPLLRNTQ
jgi:chromosome segregation ATPase